jgi:hypothetical protein
MANRTAAVGGASSLLHFVAVSAAGMLFLAARLAEAELWLAPGDSLLRHDLQLLADRGVIHGPVQTWPLSWGDIARDVSSAANQAELGAAERAALTRVQLRAAREAREEPLTRRARLALALDPRTVRTFENTQRESAELEVGVHWTGFRLSYRLQLTGAGDPEDGKELRGDGSYAGAALGNWMFAAGRNYSDPFGLPCCAGSGPGPPVS